MPAIASTLAAASAGLWPNPTKAVSVSPTAICMTPYSPDADPITCRSTVIALLKAAGAALPTPTLYTNMEPTITATFRCSVIATARNTKAAITLIALAATNSRPSVSLTISPLVTTLPSQMPEAQEGEIDPAPPSGSMTLTKMNGAQATKP
jgi:hypothetical protein